MPNLRTDARVAALCCVGLIFLARSTAHRKPQEQRLSSDQVIERTAALCSAITPEETLHVSAVYRETHQRGVWDAVCSNPADQDTVAITYDDATGIPLYAAIGVRNTAVTQPATTRCEALACGKSWLSRLRYPTAGSATIRLHRLAGAPNWTVTSEDSGLRVVMQIQASNGVLRLAQASDSAIGWMGLRPSNVGQKPHEYGVHLPFPDLR